MRHSVQTSGSAPTGAWLYVAELIHRTANDYAAAIAALRLAARRAPNAEARGSLLQATRGLDASAAVQTCLRPPIVSGPVDLTEHLVKLCSAIALARFDDRPIGLSICTAEPIMLEAVRCWQVGLVVSELIANAAKHAFASDIGRGEIAVFVAAHEGRVICSVRDTGVWASGGAPGAGAGLLHALAAELGGCIAWRSHACGTSVEMTFPLKDAPRRQRARRTEPRRAAVARLASPARRFPCASLEER